MKSHNISQYSWEKAQVQLYYMLLLMKIPK